MIEDEDGPMTSYVKKEIEKMEDEDRNVQIPTTDPWIHRHVNMLCQTCMYYVPKIGVTITNPVDTKLGRCRRHSPTMSGCSWISLSIK